MNNLLVTNVDAPIALEAAMTIRNSADCIREGLRRFRGTPLVQTDGYPGQFSFHGGTWVSQAEGCNFSVFSGHNWTFRLHSGGQQTMYVWDAALIFDGLGSLRICVTRWLEEFANPSDVRFLHTQAPAAYRSHITVQRINYTDPLRARVEGLSDSDIEDIQALIEKPMQDLLRRSVEEVQVDQKYYGKYAVPVAGALHWDWRKPMPELLTVQESILDFVRTFTPERAGDRPLSRYRSEEGARSDGSYIVTVEGEPKVRIRIPSVNREDPYVYEAEVELAGMTIPIRIEKLTSVPLHDVASNAERQELVPYLLFHPCGDHFASLKKSPIGVTRQIGDRAVEHLKNAWLALKLDRMRKLHEFVDVLVL